MSTRVTGCYPPDPTASTSAFRGSVLLSDAGAGSGIHGFQLGLRAEQLSAEANQCIGEEVAFVGQTEVTTQINPNLPNEDTASFPPEFPPPAVLPPPPPVSGTGM